MRLRVIGMYRNAARGLDYRVGDLLEVNDAQITFLMNDAPGCFEAVGKGLDGPPNDKMIDLTDGVNKVEASLAGQALNARKANLSARRKRAVRK